MKTYRGWCVFLAFFLAGMPSFFLNTLAILQPHSVTSGKGLIPSRFCQIVPLIFVKKLRATL